MPPSDSPTAPVVVIGAGALGGHLAAKLALAGEAVALVARPAQADAIARDGLQLIEAGQRQTVRLPVHTELAELVPPARAVIVCVKSADTAPLAERLAPWRRPGTLVCSLQNGVANGKALAAHLPQPLAVGLAYLAASTPTPGVIQHHGGNSLVLAPQDPTQAALARAPLEALAGALSHSGFEVQTVADARPALWRKLLINCSYNAISALLQAPYARMTALPPVHELMQQLLAEGLAVAAAEGVALDADEVRAGVARVAVSMASQRSSTAQDLARGRPTEIDHLNGHLVRRGAALGVPTPLNQAVWALVKLAEDLQAHPPA